MKMDIEKLVSTQKNFFFEGSTKEVKTRINYLKRLYKEIVDSEPEILKALEKDLGKSVTEAYMCEIGMTLSELSFQIKHIKKWSKPKTHPTALANFHGKSFTIREPYGCVLVMSPWNYPFMLSMEPLIGAVAAGNCCIVKPSAYSPATSAVINKIITNVFPAEYVAVVEGGRNENSQLLNQRFDYIFFTGSVNVGKEVMASASKNLTPVTLELGGKSPCIVDENCNIKLAATRIVFGKYLNCGQTCVAPDYILVHQKIKSQFILEVKNQISKMYTEDPLTNASYGKIINEKHFERIISLLDKDKIIVGGNYNKETLQIAPTVMDNITLDDPVMGQEIFGPIMPLITYNSIEEADAYISSMEKPLALYIFSNSKNFQKHFLNKFSYGGGCINDTIIHLATSHMPFGGVGNSGMGSYHGKYSFDTFTHEKSIIKKYCWMDLPIRYQPYKSIYLKLIRLFLH
jgi:aldehyde dehydrogenase (NAD+)